MTESTEISHRPIDAKSIEVALAIKSRLGKRDHAPVRVAFIGANDSVREENDAPPMAKILRGGRGGEVRLKLELSFLWFAVSPPHDLTYPARVWAELIGLEDPEHRGTRRVRQAITALANMDMIQVSSRPGQPNRIVLLDEGGMNHPYYLPGIAYNKVRGSKDQWRHRYIQIPDTLWTNGWIAGLSGAALAMLLILFSELGQRNHEKTDLWFSPARAKKIYGLSDDTRSKGLRELRAAGLVTARRKAASRDVLDFKRVRNTYRLQLERLNDKAEIPVVIDPEDPLTPSRMTLKDILADLTDE
ncbi:hypothetical protein CIK84_18920 [Glutamicibacter arilaitensis]|uniref:Uncharacterized protein n=2 Tax=Glutamicibacter arilaitensis TaxID=256701 RepID=A0A2N7RXB1_9MICC|nr:hypothetical protein CIK84_18920 [Glutamicibacter arilaitensis]